MIGVRLKCDCKNCTERYVGCHAVCEKYKEFQKRNEELNAKQRTSSQMYGDTGWVYCRKKRGKK